MRDVYLPDCCLADPDPPLVAAALLNPLQLIRHLAGYALGTCPLLLPMSDARVLDQALDSHRVTTPE